MALSDITEAAERIGELRPLATLRPDVVGIETLKQLGVIIANAEQMRDEMLRTTHAAGVGVRPLSRASGLSHVTVAKRLSEG